MAEQETLGSALRSAVAELQYAARTAGLIELDERIDYIPGSRTNGQEPRVEVRGPRGPRPLDLMPDFVHTTRAREVVAAMNTAAVVLLKFVGMGILPANS